MTDAPGGIYPAKWHPDPFGRHEHRWYDGSKWTEWVSDNGQKTTDPPINAGVPPVPGIAAAQPQTVVVQPQRTNSDAVTSLVLAILFLGGLGSLFAIILGQRATTTIKKTGEAGEGLAQAGFLLGIIGVAGAVVMWYFIYQATQTPDCSPYSYSC